MFKNLKIFNINRIKEIFEEFCKESVNSDKINLAFDRQLCLCHNIGYYIPKSMNKVYRPVSKVFSFHLDRISQDYSTPFLKSYFDFAINHSEISATLKPYEVAHIRRNIYDPTFRPKIALHPFDGTNKTYTCLIHELGHFYQFYNKYIGNNNEPEYFAEVIPIFFEYLMHQETSLSGYNDFLNNRLSMISRSKHLFNSNVKSLLNECKSNDELFKDINIFIMYLMGFNIAIGYINRRNEDKKYFDKLLSEVILGKSNSLEMAKKLDINPGEYEHVAKVLRLRKV